MNTPPRRARFQIHLSTAIVLMFAAGGLMWANSYGRRVEERGAAWNELGTPALNQRMTESEFLASDSDVWAASRSIEHGWPFNAMKSSTFVWIDRSDKILRTEPRPDTWRIMEIIHNALIALGILLAVCVLCEWLIRRRAARKGV